MKQFLISICAFTLFHFSLPAQDDYAKEKKTFGERLVFGGNLGLSFGTVTYVELSPDVGYKFTDRMIGGVGITYIYLQSGDYSTSVYGGSLFGQYLIANNFFARTEYQMVNADCFLFGSAERKNIPHLWIGGGYHSGLGQGVGVGIMLMYDVIEDPCSPYSNPNIRVGFNMGF